MKSFYTLSQIRIALLSPDGEEILAYPTEFTDFCTYMRQRPESCRQCRQSDRNAFQKCALTEQPVVYRCHAGLTEAAHILRVNGEIAGYIMFGQITDECDREAFVRDTLQKCAVYGCPNEKTARLLCGIPYKSNDELTSAIKIFEICIHYILHGQLIWKKNAQIVQTLDAYVDAHIGEPIDVEDLTNALYISRTKLYDIVRTELGVGVARYIRRRKLERAKRLLQTTTLSFSEIAGQCGYDDLNYFRRSFRAEYGISLKQCRFSPNTDAPETRR